MSSRVAKLLLVLLLACTPALASVPAHADGVSGRNCKGPADVRRCAGFKSLSAHGIPPFVLAIVSATAENGAVADVRKVVLQRVVKGRWQTVRSKTPPYGYTSLEGESIHIKCRRLKPSAYRIRGHVKWIIGGSAHQGWITSRVRTKAQLC